VRAAGADNGQRQRSGAFIEHEWTAPSGVSPGRQQHACPAVAGATDETVGPDDSVSAQDERSSGGHSASAAASSQWGIAESFIALAFCIIHALGTAAPGFSAPSQRLRAG
jgi:hypothetical protein